MLSRGDDIEESYKRSLSDEGRFDSIKAEVNCIINNPEFQLGEGHMLAGVIDVLHIEIISRLRGDVKRTIKERLKS